MIIWLASYPRSGNTFLRIVLHQLYGVSTYSIYDDNDPVAQRIGPTLVGYQPKPFDCQKMAQSSELFFVKTHKRRKSDPYPAIHLVRDGRDAVVSHARLRASQDAAGDQEAAFQRRLHEEICRPYVEGQPSSGTWGGHALSWLDHEGPVSLLRYEDLIADPCTAVARAVSHVLPELPSSKNPYIPSFPELQKIDSQFFRRGACQSHRDEMPPELAELFWAQTENATAMLRLQYSRETGDIHTRHAPRL